MEDRHQIEGRRQRPHPPGAVAGQAPGGKREGERLTRAPTVCDLYARCMQGCVSGRSATMCRWLGRRRASGRTGTSRSGSSTASLPGGELITEGEIAEALGMSRTPVRAAFAQLEAEGLLRLYPKRGALVVPVSAAGDGGGDRDPLGDRALRDRAGDRAPPAPSRTTAAPPSSARTGSRAASSSRPTAPSTARSWPRTGNAILLGALRLPARPPAPHGPRHAPARPSSSRRSWTSTARSPTRSPAARPSARSRALRAHLDNSLAKLRSLSV